MKRTNKYKIKRFLQMIYVISKKSFKGDKRAKYPKVMTEKEKTVASIFLTILHEPETVLYYNPETYECYLQSDVHKISMFLEPQNVTVINSIYGYDTKISQKLEVYLSERFKHETSKRRNIFKKEILAKVEHSLINTLDKIYLKKDKK